MKNVRMLTGYLVDRARVRTINGEVEGVVMALRVDGAEYRVSLSKEDAIILAANLQEAGMNARHDHQDNLGIREYKPITE